MLTKGQHTCKLDGGLKNILKESPFLAKHKPEKHKLQFLGEGYYFWDNNIEMAHIWGKQHCKNNYCIIELDLEITEKTCLDLVGNRKHQIFLVEMLNKLKEKGFDRKKWNISNCIEYLKSLRKHNKNIFPYNTIRALDYISPDELKQVRIDFVNNVKHYTVLNPKITICAIDKNLLPLQSKKIIYSSKKHENGHN